MTIPQAFVEAARIVLNRRPFTAVQVQHVGQQVTAAGGRSDIVIKRDFRAFGYGNRVGHHVGETVQLCLTITRTVVVQVNTHLGGHHVNTGQCSQVARINVGVCRQTLTVVQVQRAFIVVQRDRVALPFNGQGGLTRYPDVGDFVACRCGVAVVIGNVTQRRHVPAVENRLGTDVGDLVIFNSRRRVVLVFGKVTVNDLLLHHNPQGLATLPVQLAVNPANL